MAPFEDSWAEIESDPEYQALKASNPKAAAQLVRKFARKVARQEVKGSDPRMAAFLGKNLPGAGKPTRSGIGDAAAAGAREGFDQSAVGMLTNAATGRKQHDGPGALQAIKDAASNIYSGANSLPIPSPSLALIQALRDPSAGQGYAGAAGSMLGQAPDIIAGGGLAAAATKGLTRAGVKALPAAVAASVGTNAATGAAVTKATGGTNSDAAKNAALMGAAGLLPFAGKIPAGRLNPNITRPKPPAPAPAPVAPPPARPSGTPQQRAQDAKLVGDAARAVLAKTYGNTPGTPEFIGLAAGRSAEAERLGAMSPARPAIPADSLPPEALLPSMPRSIGPRPDPMLDLPTAALTAPAQWRATGQMLGRSAGEALAPDATARPSIPADSLPPEALLPAPLRGLAQAPEPFLDMPDAVRQAMRAPIPAPGRQPLALPPAGGTGWSGDVIPAPAIGRAPGMQGVFDADTLAASNWSRDLALYDQIANRPGTWRKKTPPQVDVNGNKPDSPWYIDPRELEPMDFTPENDTTILGMIAETKKSLAKSRRLQTSYANKAKTARAERGVGDGRTEDQLEFYNYQETLRNEAALKALEAEAAARGLSTGKKRGGGSLQRLAREEEGSMRLPLGSPSQAQEAGRAVRRRIGIAARTGLDGAARIGEPLRRVNDAVTGAVRAGLDRTGATRATDAMARAWEYRKSPDWLPGNPVATGLRRAFISDFGVPPELLQMAREADRQARREVGEFRQTATLLNDSLSPSAQQALDRQITEPGTPRSQAAEDVAAEASRLSQLLEDVGALSPEARSKWDGYYLPRIYMDKFPVVSGLVKTAAKLMKGYKARGTEKQMSPAAFEAERDAWEFRGYTGPGADKLARAEAALEALQAERATAPPEKHATLDRKIEAATERQLDALATPGLKVRAWRDWTVEERAKMGEVRHASLRMLKMAQRFEQDFKNGSLLKEIASNPDWVQKIPKGVDPTAAPEGFVYFKDIDAAAPGGVKKWGAVAGHWVREDVAHYLRANIELPRNLAWVKSATGLNVWKRFVTLYNPSYFVNNAAVNIPTLEIAGGSAFDLPAAGRDFIDGSELYRALEERGTINNGHTARDLAMQLETTYARTPEQTAPGPLEVLAALGSAAQKVEAGLGSVAQGTDDLFRLALVKRLMKPEAEGGRGMTLDQAADVAEASFYDPTRVTAPAAQYMEAFGFPFIKVLFYQLDRMPQLVLENPAKAATLTGYFVALEAILNAAAGVDSDQADGRRQLMSEHMRPRGNSLNLPMKDAYGKPLVMDTKNFNPLAFAETTDRTAIPGLPAGLVPGGPLAISGAIGTNYDAFRRRNIRDPQEDMGVQLGQVGEYVRNNALPAGIFNKVGKVVDAAQGRTDSAGRRYDMLTALMNLGGLKVQPLDLDLSYDRLEGQYDGKIRDIDAQIRAAERSLEANPQDAAKLEAEIQRLEDRSARMEDERDRALSRAEKAFPIPTPAPAVVSP